MGYVFKGKKYTSIDNVILNEFCMNNSKKNVVRENLIMTNMTTATGILYFEIIKLAIEKQLTAIC